MLNKAGVELIKHFEGLRLRAYKPMAAEKYWTIGYGHYGPDVAADAVWTAEQAEQALIKDTARYYNSVVEMTATLNMNENQLAALTSFAYNCGIEGLRTSTAMKRLRAGNIPGALEALTWWNKGADGKVLPGLVRRRSYEVKLFMEPVAESITAESAIA